MLGALIVLKLMTNYLGSQQFGLYSLVLSIMALVAVLPYNSIAQALNRYYSIYQHKKQTEQLLFVYLKYFLYISGFYFIVFFVTTLFLNIELSLAGLVFLLVLSEVTKTLMKGVLNSARSRKEVAISSVSEFTLKIVSVYLLYQNDLLSLKVAIFVFILANFASILASYKRSVFKFSKPIEKKQKLIFKRLLLFSAPLILWGFFGWARDMSNRWYLEWYVDTESVAIYTVLTSVAMIYPTVIQSLVSAYYVPILYQRENERKGSVAQFMNRLAIVFMLCLTPFLFLLDKFSVELIVLFSSNFYAGYSHYLVYMVFVYAMYVLSSTMAIEVFAAKKTSYLIFPNIFPGLVSMVVGYIFIKEQGFDGAIISYFVTYSVFAFIMFLTIYFFRKRVYALEKKS